jgi:hypothetical protein
MSEKISQRIFILELIFIVFPLSLLLLFATLYVFYWTTEFFVWDNIANSLFALIACVSALSGLLIARAFIKHGSSELHNLRSIFWVFSFLGVALPIAAMVSQLLPPSPEYSVEEMFRNDFEYFVLGFPMVIPLVHLTLERYLRKERA